MQRVSTVVRFLGLGVVLTGLAAVACAMLANPYANELVGASGHRGRFWLVSVHRATGAVAVWRAPRTSEPDEHSRAVDVPRWSRARSAPTADAPDSDYRWVEDARGWPFLCAVSQRAVSFSSPRGRWVFAASRSGLTLTGEQAPLGAPRTVPLRPIWAGLAADSIVFAIAAWLIVESGRRIRGRLRTRRGRCPACGYDVRTLPACPECGLATSHGGSAICMQAPPKWRRARLILSR